MSKKQRIYLLKTLSFWSYKRERVKAMHLLSDYQLFKVALRKFNKSQIREIITE